MTLNSRSRLEIHIEEKCCEHAEKLGFEHIKLDKAKRGWPDRQFFGPYGFSVLVEFKRPGKKARPQQKGVHRRLDALGHPVILIDTLDQFKALLD